MKPYNNQFNVQKKPLIHFSTEQKITGGIGLLTLIILIGGVWLLTMQDAKEQVKLNKSLMGEAVPIQGAGHVKEGGYHPAYDSNPPTSGWMYDGVAGDGIHDSEVADELLVHSMEHGAVVVWYKDDLPKEQVEQIKVAFNTASGKKIMLARRGLSVPVALTSWGRLLKLATIESSKITEFINTNEDRGPEKAPI